MKMIRSGLEYTFDYFAMPRPSEHNPRSLEVNKGDNVLPLQFNGVRRSPERKAGRPNSPLLYVQTDQISVIQKRVPGSKCAIASLLKQGVKGRKRLGLGSVKRANPKLDDAIG